jgi:hypothetical protein
VPKTVAVTGQTRTKNKRNIAAQWRCIKISRNQLLSLNAIKAGKAQEEGNIELVRCYKLRTNVWEGETAVQTRKS